MTVQVKQILAQLGDLPDVIWSFDNSWLYELDLFGKSTFKIAHVMDFNLDYETSIFARSANLCLGVTDEIVDRLKGFNSQSHFVGHGYHRIDVQGVKSDGQTRPIALYSGNLLIPFLKGQLLL